MTWLPHVTVATVIERDGRFLLVEEISDGARVFNQPAGHLDPQESLIEAAVRETLEETGWLVEVSHVVGLALYTSPSNGVTYYRTTFAATPVRHDESAKLDEGIIGPCWLTLEEVRGLHDQGHLRSHLVLSTIEHYLAGHRYPLELFYT